MMFVSTCVTKWKALSIIYFFNGKQGYDDSLCYTMSSLHLLFLRFLSPDIKVDKLWKKTKKHVTRNTIVVKTFTRKKKE